jgi:hypothetical protein
MTGLKTHGQHCVVRKKERVRYNRPCAIPRDFLLIDKDAHKFDNSKCWMGLKLPSAVMSSYALES